MTLVATRLPQLDVASFHLHLPSQLNVATSITCQARLSRGSCLVTFPVPKPGFHLRMFKDAKTELMLINVADFGLLNDQALTSQLLRDTLVRLGSDNTTSDLPHWWNQCWRSMLTFFVR